MRSISVVIADRHPVVLLGLKGVLESQRDFKIVAYCGDGRSCIEAIRSLAPDIAVIDASMAGLTGSEILAIARQENLPTRLCFFTASADDDELVISASAGACSVILRDIEPDLLVQYLRRIADNQTVLPLLSSEPFVPQEQSATAENAFAVLTDRERQIMRLVSEGLSNKEIGRRLNIADGTIKVHLHHIFQKLEVSNRTVLAALAISQSDNASGSVLETDNPRPRRS